MNTIGEELVFFAIAAIVEGQNSDRRPFFGFGFNWGEPNEDTFGSGLDDQYSTELFYRFQAAERLAFTGDVQWLKDPALNPDESSIWMFNLRARLVL